MELNSIINICIKFLYLSYKRKNILLPVSLFSLFIECFLLFYNFFCINFIFIRNLNKINPF